MDRAVLETASDRYAIVEYLAEGGMGAIYLGKKLGVDGFEKEVVLKQLLPELTSQPKFIDLFLREARLSATLEHVNIVRTVDLVNAGDDYFMVMEYVRGGDLRTLLRRIRRRRQRFSPSAVSFVGRELLEALAYAHAKSGVDGKPLGLIHRDVSPSNILLSGTGEVKLTDFGIAKASTHRSVFARVKGKVGYMAPEQAKGQSVDARSDLFSLGVVMWEMLVGERLFVGNLTSSASELYSQRITRPSLKREGLPPELDDLILRALKLDPNERFQSAEDFQDALARVAAHCRLLISHAEMASHLATICGPDPNQWLKLEALGNDDSQAIAQGTAVLTGATGSTGSTSAFDDDDPFYEPSVVGQVRHEQGRELTSVIGHNRAPDFSDDLRDLDLPPDPEDEPPPEGSTAPENRRRVATPSGVQTIVRTPRSSPVDDAITDAQSQAGATRREIPAPPAERVRSVVEQAPTMPGRMVTVGAAAPGGRPAVQKRAVWLLVVLLALVGIGVAVGVALSGPEVEVVDPTQSPLR